jgi:hypothetical protein
MWGDAQRGGTNWTKGHGKGGWVNKICRRKEMCSPYKMVLKGRVGKPGKEYIVMMFSVECTRPSSLGQMFSTSTSASNNQTSSSGGAQPQQDGSHPAAGHHPECNLLYHQGHN